MVNFYGLFFLVPLVFTRCFFLNFCDSSLLDLILKSSLYYLDDPCQLSSLISCDQCCISFWSHVFVLSSAYQMVPNATLILLNGKTVKDATIILDEKVLKVHKHKIFFYFFCRNRILMVPGACNTRFLKIVFDSAEIFDYKIRTINSGKNSFRCQFWVKMSKFISLSLGLSEIEFRLVWD